MCGIFGIQFISKGLVDLQALQRAVRLMRHRGPDDEGFLLANPAAGLCVPCTGPDSDARLKLPSLEFAARQGAFPLALGHRRLSILDLSPAGHQPMQSADGQVWIVYNGEVYNYLELRKELEREGFAFRSGTDTEVILAAYQRWGDACLERFNGIWGFAIWDRRRRRLFCSRDHFGVKPFYYVWDGNRFAFASEIKALIGGQGVAFRPNEPALHRFLSRGEMPPPSLGATFFENVRQLPPASFLVLENGRLRTERYYDLPAEPRRPPRDRNEVIADLRDLVRDAVKLQLVSDVPVGTALSGGVDSSTIVCIINELMAERGGALPQIGERQKTFSAVYETEGAFNERRHVENVLKAVRAEGHFTVPTSQRLRQEAERLIWHQDEPFGGTSIFAQWCVMEEARRNGVVVTLDGQGADEYLAGYRFVLPACVADLVRSGHWIRAALECRALGQSEDWPAGRILWRALSRLAPRFLKAWKIRGALARQYRAPFLNPAFTARMGGSFDPTAVLQRTEHSLDGILRDLLLETFLPDLLRYEDRNSMAYGVESRVPFLDRRLVEFVFREAWPWRIYEGWTKWPLRKAMEGTVPHAVIWRPDKVPFSTPEGEWLKEWMAEDQGGLRSDSPGAEYIVAPKVAEMARVLTVENAASGSGVWRCLCVDLWLRVFNQGGPDGLSR